MCLAVPGKVIEIDGDGELRMARVDFSAGCTPEHPLGATMVSSEGACAAYFHYGRGRRDAAPGGTA